jgi:predicted nucleotidyltransferase
MLINLIDKNCAKILLTFIMSPGRKWNRKEIRERTGLNNVPLDISLNKLLFLKIINEKNRIYSLNLDNTFVKNLLEEREILVNLPFNVQFALIDLIDGISKFRGIDRVILFGSYSKLVFTDNSDIDLAIIVKNGLEYEPKLEKQIFVISDKISKKHKKNIECHFFEEKDMKHKEDAMIRDILRNGRVLI